MRGRYRSPPLRLNGGQEEEEEEEDYSSSKYGHNKRRRRRKRLITQAIFTLLVMFVLLVGCALLLRGAEGGGGGGVRYARRSAVFKHGHGKADSSTITHEDVTSRMTNSVRQASLAWTAILKDTSVHVTHTTDGSLRSMASRDAYLRRTSALALELLAADDAVMVEWAQEKVDERSRMPHDDGVKMESVHLSEEEEEDASPASHGLSTGSGIGGQEVIHGEDNNEEDENGDASGTLRYPRRASAGHFGSESENDILYETMNSEHADRVTIVRLTNELREDFKSNMAGFYNSISRLGSLNRQVFGTPEYFARKWQKYISMTPSFDDRIFRGRGIVICGGGLRYIGSLWLTIKMLREQGSVLPIEIFGFGGEQPTPLLRKLFEDQNASFVSMDEIIPGGSTLFKGYVLKIFAILFSSFAEVLSLDSDNMPLVNVDTFFLDQASGDAAQETVDRYQPDRDGALFWPDFWSASVDSDLLLTLGIDPVVNEWMGTHDSGQMLVQKRKGWDALMLATFMSLHADTMYPMLTRNGVGIGDKEVLPLCFMALRIPAFKVRRSILPVGFVSHEQGEGDDPTKSTRKRMIDCGEDGGVGSVASAACNDLAHLREIVSSESRIQDNDMGYASTAQKMSREVQVTFHGTTMGQYSPDETQGIALMHKNCDKWLTEDAVDPEFASEVTWTHYKPFNRTLSEMESLDQSSGVERGGSEINAKLDLMRKEVSVPMHVVSDVPRFPRKKGPGHICEVDVYDSTAHALLMQIPNIEAIERRARLILHEFALSEAFAQYERWRKFRFHEGMETEDVVISRCGVPREPMNRH